MSVRTAQSLSSNTIERLQDLIQINIDSVNGFNEAAGDTSDERLRTLFRTLGADRAELANELQAQVAMTGERPQTKGSLLAQIHQTWLSLRSKLATDDAVAVLEEAERGEDAIKKAYEDAIQDTHACGELNDLLLAQYRIVKSGHDQVRDLRDAYKAAR